MIWKIKHLHKWVPPTQFQNKNHNFKNQFPGNWPVTLKAIKSTESGLFTMDIEQPGSVVTLIAYLIFLFYKSNLEFPMTTIQIQHELSDITSVAVEFNLYLLIQPGNKPANSLAVEETHGNFDLITVTDCQSVRLSKIYLRIVELIESCQSKLYLFSMDECTHTGNSHKMTLGEVYFFNCTWINNCNGKTAYMYVEHYWVLKFF